MNDGDVSVSGGVNESKFGHLCLVLRFILFVHK